MTKNLEKLVRQKIRRLRLGDVEDKGKYIRRYLPRYDGRDKHYKYMRMRI